MKGSLYLIPTTLGDTTPMDVLPKTVKDIVDKLDYFIVENEKVARRFIKSISPDKKQSSLHLFSMGKHSEKVDYYSYIDVCENGFSVGLLSDAGVPAIADPGALIVEIAHKKDIRVVPLVGPSSILLAMMASGMNGQSFTFNGYLPIEKYDRKKKIKELERISHEKDQSQLFIETPYRNQKMLEELMNTLNPMTRLCVACDISLSTEFIRTYFIKEWKANFKSIDLHKRPSIFIIHK